VTTPPDVVQHLAQAARGLRTTDVGQWHVTLAFLGQVPDAAPLVPVLAAAAAGTPPLDLQLSGSGLWRGQGVVYAGLAGDLDGLHGLAGRVADACRAAGVRVEDRPYRPHLTVARRAPRDAGLLAGYLGPPWTAAEVELVRSRLGQRAVHEVLERFPLGAG
jgi:2'-5' RNA ligase